MRRVLPVSGTQYAGSVTLVRSIPYPREPACLAFQIEPCFSEPEELEDVAEPLIPPRRPGHAPRRARAFPTTAGLHAPAPARRGLHRTPRRRTRMG